MAIHVLVVGFQLDDEPILYKEMVGNHQTSILKWLFRVPGCNFLLISCFFLLPATIFIYIYILNYIIYNFYLLHHQKDKHDNEKTTM